jgi:hypothetical protein
MFWSVNLIYDDAFIGLGNGYHSPWLILSKSGSLDQFRTRMWLIFLGEFAIVEWADFNIRCFQAKMHIQSYLKEKDGIL